MMQVYMCHISYKQTQRGYPMPAQANPSIHHDEHNEFLGHDTRLVSIVSGLAEGKNKTKQLSIPIELDTECKAIAKENGMNYNEWIISAMREALSRRKGVSLFSEPDIALIRQTAEEIADQVGEAVANRTKGQYDMLLEYIKGC